jgi:hypothetical protein
MRAADQLVEVYFQRIWAQVRDIDGWLTEKQALLLWRSAIAAPGDKFAEIGSHRGKSAAVLICSRPSVNLLAVDPWEDVRWGGGSESFDCFRRNLESIGCWNRVEVFRGLSTEAFEKLESERRFDLVYLDGAHDYATARGDMASWRTLISKHGLLGIHDCFSSVGVTRALLIELFCDREWRYVSRERSLLIFKRERDPWLKWFLGRLLMVPCLLWFGRNLVVKTAKRQGWKTLALALGHRQATDPF